MSPTSYPPALAPERRRTPFCRMHQAFLLFLGLLLFAPQLMFGGPVPYPKKNPLTVTGNLPTGVATEAYSGSITASGGTAPYLYKAASLPKGLAISNSTGAITGTSSSTGQFAFSVYVTDAAGNYGNGAFTVTFNQPPVSISVAPGTLTLPSAGTQQFLATVLNTTNTAVKWTASFSSVRLKGQLRKFQAFTSTPGLASTRKLRGSVTS